MKATLRIVVIGVLFSFFGLGNIHAQTFKISPNGNVTACTGDSVTVEALSGFTAYRWSNGSTNRVVKLGASGTYVCTARDSNGNYYTDTVHITFVNGKKATLGMVPSNGIVCSGDSLFIEANHGFTKYKWGTGAYGRTIVLYPTKSGYITMETIDSNGCYAKTAIYYQVKSCTSSKCGKLIYAYPDAHLCGSHDSVQMELPKGYTSYVWDDSVTGRNRTVKNDGWYYVTVTDSSGHTCRDSVKVTKGNKYLSVWFYPNPPVICPGGTVVAEISNDYDSIWWSNGAKHSNRQTFSPTKTTSYVVEAVDKYGCEYRAEFKITVKDTCNGCDNLIGSSKKNLCGKNDSIIIEAKNGFVAYSWSNGKTGRHITVKSKGWYYVTALKADSTTCKDSIYIGEGVNELEVFRYPKGGSICPGDTAIVYIANRGYDSIFWVYNAKNVYYSKYAPTKTSTYVVYAFDSNGCVHRGLFTIEVKDTCHACYGLISASKKTICGEKDSVILEAKTGFVKYVWSNRKEGRINVVKTKGWYILAAMKSDSTICYDSIYIGEGGKAIEIGSNPKNATVCKGDSIELEATWGFKTYTWSVYGKKHANGIKFKPAESMKVYVEGVDENGCKSKTYIYVTVVDCKKCPRIIEAWPSTSLCGRDSVGLEAKHGYKYYKWSTGTEGRILWVKKAGWYWLDFKDSSGNVCRDSIYITSGSTKELKVRIYPERKVCKGDTIVFSASEGFKSYAWNTGNKTRSFEYVAEKNKEIVVEAVDSHGCVARTVYKLIVDSCRHSSTSSLEQMSVNIFPNPVQTICTIEANGLMIQSIELFDLYGRLVLTKSKIYTNQYQIDMTNLNDGGYILRYSTSAGVSYQTLIKTNP